MSVKDACDESLDIFEFSVADSVLDRVVGSVLECLDWILLILFVGEAVSDEGTRD